MFNTKKGGHCPPFEYHSTSFLVFVSVCVTTLGKFLGKH